MELVEILETFRQKIADGNKTDAENFLVEHFKELPESLQGDLLIELIKDAGSEHKLESIATDVADMAMKVVDRTETAEEEMKKIIADREAEEARK
ncbi:hypothetical protein HYW59_04160 [Candidatus Kaiserbacteria bacterium]|nr:hypothetical protein [Candidatus Kaiserbacteria bacterium]